MISETSQMIVEMGNNGNLATSSGCQVAEAGRPVRRLRRKRRLPLDSEDEEENAYEDEVNKAACTLFKESCEKQGQLSQSSLCSANCAEGSCSVPRAWSGSDPDFHQWWEYQFWGVTGVDEQLRWSESQEFTVITPHVSRISVLKYCCVILKISVRPRGWFGFYSILAWTLTAPPETSISGA